MFGKSGNGKVFLSEEGKNSIALGSGTGVVPGDGLDRGLIEFMIVGDVGTAGVSLRERAVTFHIHLLDAAEAAKLALDTVEVAVMVAVGAAECATPPLVAHRDFFHAMHGERQLGDPGFAGLFILQVKLGGGGVLDFRFRAQVVPGFYQQMGFLPAHEIDVADGATRVARQGRRPDQAGRAIAQQIERRYGRQVVDARESTDGAPFAPCVAGLVEVKMHAIAGEVQDVHQAGAIDIREANAMLVEHIGRIEPRRMVHGDLGAEAGVAQIGPIAHFAIANAHEVGQAIPRHVRQVDGLRTIGEHETRSLLFIDGLTDFLAGPEAGLRQRRVPTEGFVFGD